MDTKKSNNDVKVFANLMKDIEVGPMRHYMIGSHNSWSYAKPKKWWMKPFRFVAQCQDWDIKRQYDHGVRCFDLRLQYDGDNLRVVHGFMIYDISIDELLEDLKWLNDKQDVRIRVLHDARTQKLHNLKAIQHFKDDCAAFEELYPNIRFWCGQNLYDHTTDYEFKKHYSCSEYYSSVILPKIDDIYPRYYAKKNNKAIYKRGTDDDILLIDFVNYVL